MKELIRNTDDVYKHLIQNDLRKVGQGNNRLPGEGELIVVILYAMRRYASTRLQDRVTKFEWMLTTL